MTSAAKKYYNRTNFVVALGDASLAQSQGLPPLFYCSRKFNVTVAGSVGTCGPVGGPQCGDCYGYSIVNVPPSCCYNKAGIRMALGNDRKYYCGKSFSLASRLRKGMKARCHETLRWQCPDCAGYTASDEPPALGRTDPTKAEVCGLKYFAVREKKPTSSDGDGGCGGYIISDGGCGGGDGGGGCGGDGDGGGGDGGGDGGDGGGDGGDGGGDGGGGD
jgi:hypothetical protein